MTVERESMEVDVLFVGAGPANLAGAIHLMKLINQHNEDVEAGKKEGEKFDDELMVMMIEKAQEIGLHGLSGAVVDKKTIFDGHDWLERKPGQPFFAQVHIGQPHRKFVKSDRPRRDAPIPACYPEHPVTRADWANYLATIEVMDRKVGAILDRVILG